MSFDLFAEITQRIVDQLEAGTVPWHKPWTGGNECAMSHVTGKPYSLINHILLGGRTGEYLTFKQCTDEGGTVKKGEKARMIIFWKLYEDVDQETGENLYVGRTVNLRRRLYTNHLMGPKAVARLKKYLTEDETEPEITSMEEAKQFLRDRCYFQYIPVDDVRRRGQIEGMLGFFLDVRYIHEEH